MSGGMPLSIPITEMIGYCSVFNPPVSTRHFIRVVRAADNEFLNIQADKQAKKTSSQSGERTPPNGGNVFPKL